MKLCPGTMDWHCTLPEGHAPVAGPYLGHEPGALKGATGREFTDTPWYKAGDTSPRKKSDTTSIATAQRRASDGRPSRRKANVPNSV